MFKAACFGGEMRRGFFTTWAIIGGLLLVMVANAQASQIRSFIDNFDSVDLVDQHGRPFVASEFDNRVVLFNFIFTGCDSTCPIQTRSLAQVLTGLSKEVRSQVRFVSVSIDPGNDTPEKLKKFAHSMGADMDGWLFVTGDVIKLQEIAQRLHLMSEDSPNDPSIHRTSLWLVDKQGRMLQRFRGNPPDQERLIRELTQVVHLPVATR